MYLFHFFLLFFFCTGLAMDLESFEADLADYSLQETPFYDTATIYDYSMSIIQQKFIVMKSSDINNGGIVKKNKPRKSVSFLPNYVQVCNYILSFYMGFNFIVGIVNLQ